MKVTLCVLCFFSVLPPSHLVFFFFNDTATTEIYTLSLHDALPIAWAATASATSCSPCTAPKPSLPVRCACPRRSEEHTSELQSRRDLVCRLLLEKKKKEGASTVLRQKKKAYTQ